MRLRRSVRLPSWSELLLLRTTSYTSGSSASPGDILQQGANLCYRSAKCFRGGREDHPTVTGTLNADELQQRRSQTMVTQDCV